MKKISVIGATLVAAAVLCAAPVSLHLTQDKGLSWSVDKARAVIGRPLTPGALLASTADIIGATDIITTATITIIVTTATITIIATTALLSLSPSRPLLQSSSHLSTPLSLLVGQRAAFLRWERPQPVRLFP